MRKTESVSWKGLRGLASVQLALALLACGDQQTESAPALRPVRYERVTSSVAVTERSLAGVVRAGVESRLSFRVPGSVQRLAVKVGTAVDRGTVLARLDPTDYELRVEEAKAALAQAEAGLRRAEADYDRVRALYENNNASKAELDAARATAESGKAQVEAVSKQLDQADQQLGYTVLRAPQPGAIASVDVEVNENVRAGQQICLLVSASRPEVAISVPEGMISEVRQGQRVEVKLDALPGRRFDAEITEVGVAVTSGATTYSVSARFVEPHVDIRAGMAAEVTLRFEQPDRQRILVPPAAVGEDREGRFVFVVEPEGETEGTVRRRAVTVRSGDRGVEIVEGLEEGELLVTAGSRRLSDGQRVKLDGVHEDR